jgi:large subunit ribosomal protein L6
MSRIGKQPVKVPAGVDVSVQGTAVQVKGPKGTLNMSIRPEIEVKVEGGSILVSLSSRGGGRESRAYHGMTRALINNMVMGVTKGFQKKLEIVGVGWNAKAQPKSIVLNIGFCHPVEIPLPDGVTAETPKPTNITITGVDKQAVGQVAAVIRKVRPPEPYKGKGVRYEGEYVRRKAGKSFGS